MIFSRRSVGQPQVAARINWGHSITRGLTFCMVGSNPLLDVVSGAVAEELRAMAGASGSEMGVGPFFTANTLGGVVFPQRQPITNRANCTMLGITNAPASSAVGNYGPLFIQQSEGNIACLMLGVNFTTAPSAGSVGYFKLNTTANSRGGGIASVVDGEWHCHAISSASTTTARYSRDGEPATGFALSDSGGTFFLGDERPMVGGRRANGTYSLAHPIPLSMAWDRALTDEELREVTGNPWQLFAPRRIWVPQAPPPSLPTLSLPTYTPGSLTAGGFNPRVTAT